MKHILFSQQIDSVLMKNIVSVSDIHSIWFWLSIIDMSNIMDSINQSRDLYTKLCSLCHPDRFVNTPKEKIAEEIFQEISKNKRNFKELSLLKTREKIEMDVDM